MSESLNSVGGTERFEQPKRLVLGQALGLLLILLFVSIECTTITDPPVQSVGEIYPLAVGNQWVYFVTLGTGLQYYDTVRVVGDTLVDGQKWYRISRLGGKSLAENRWDGCYIWGLLTLPGLHYKYPAATGDTYSFPVKNLATGSVDSVDVNVTSQTQAITTQAGNFLCYGYHSPQTNIGGIVFSEVDYYFAPNKGLVLSTSYLHPPGSGPDTTRFELVSYTVNIAGQEN